MTHLTVQIIAETDENESLTAIVREAAYDEVSVDTLIRQVAGTVEALIPLPVRPDLLFLFTSRLEAYFHGRSRMRITGTEDIEDSRS